MQVCLVMPGLCFQFYLCGLSEISVVTNVVTEPSAHHAHECALPVIN